MPNNIDLLDLGGVFTFVKSKDELSPEITNIYDKFVQDPESELKLIHPIEYYGPVIQDYINKRKYKHNNNSWITNPLTVKFYYYKNPGADIFNLALNHGISDLCKNTYKGKFNIIKNSVSILYKLSILIDLKVDPNIILQSVLYHKEYCDDVIEFLRHIPIPEINKEYIAHFQNISEIIYILCQYGHLEAIKGLINLGSNLNYDKNRLFTNACRNGHLNVIKYLVSINLATPKVLEHVFKTAVSHGHLKIVKYLVNQGVDIKIDDDYAFRRSINYNYFHILKYVLKKDPTILDRVEYAMIIAIHNENIPVIKLLIKSNYKYINKIDILSSITIQGNVRILKLVLDTKIVTLSTDDILRNISVAIQYNNFDLMKLYLDMYPYMNGYQHFHLKQAVEYNNKKIVKYLLSINEYSESDLIQLIKVCKCRKIRHLLKIQLNTKK